MKLVEINDVRVGQVWKNKKEMITIDSFYDDEEIQISAYNLSGKEIDMDYDDFEGMIDIDAVKQNYKLIGKLGITHRIEGNRLLEIPREDLVVDDVVEYLDFDGFKVTAVIASLITGMTREDSQYGFITNDGNFDESSLFEKEEIGEDSGIFTYIPKKIGILGVTHEFVNDKEA